MYLDDGLIYETNDYSNNESYEEIIINNVDLNAKQYNLSIKSLSGINYFDVLLCKIGRPFSYYTNTSILTNPIIIDKTPSHVDVKYENNNPYYIFLKESYNQGWYVENTSIRAMNIYSFGWGNLFYVDENVDHLKLIFTKNELRSFTIILTIAVFISLLLGLCVYNLKLNENKFYNVLRSITHKVKYGSTFFLNVVSYIPFSPYRGIIWSCLDKSTNSYLDIGCEYGKVNYVLKKFKTFDYAIGLDIFPKYLSVCKSNNQYDHLILASASHIPFSRQSFDTVICTEVIEHLSYRDGFLLLDDVEKIASKQIILSTTKTTDEKLKKITTNRGIENVAMVHQSNWEPCIFSKRGYSVIGVFPYVRTKSDYFDIIYILSNFIPLILICYNRPSIAKSFMCIRKI